MNLITEDITSLEAECAKSVVEGFGEKSFKIIDKAADYYGEGSKQYNKETRDKIRGEMVEQITQRLFQCFDS